MADLKLTEDQKSITFARGMFRAYQYAHKSLAVGEFIKQSLGDVEFNEDETVVSQLTTGSTLCHLWNKYAENEDEIIDAIHEGKVIISAHLIHFRRNIEEFTESLTELDDFRGDVFEVNDLLELKNPSYVIDVLFQYAQLVKNRGGPDIDEIYKQFQLTTPAKEVTMTYNQELTHADEDDVGDEVLNSDSEEEKDEPVEEPGQEEEEPATRTRTAAVEYQPTPEPVKPEVVEPEAKPVTKPDAAAMMAKLQTKATEAGKLALAKAQEAVRDLDQEKIKAAGVAALEGCRRVPAEAWVMFAVLSVLALFTAGPACC